MRTAALTLLLSFMATHAATAQEPVPVVEPTAAQAQQQQQTDAPSRVARLSFIEGEVSVAPAGSEEWAQALLNRPLTTDDRVWVDNNGKAELQIGSATIYLDQRSGFSFVDLDDELLHMNLTEGAVTVRVRSKRENESIEIQTPNATVSLLHPGEYSISVNEDGDATVVRTRNGESEVASENNTYKVRANEEGVFRSSDDNGGKGLTANISTLRERTAFEEWANERERSNDGSISSRYVSSEVIGYEDLDRNGEWIHEPEYGHVWRPTYVVAGWAPYRFGRWVWVSPWGWTWVDNARWGFAPFHYGRWAYLRSRWCWVPGPRHIRPVYAPALVAWVGSGSGVSLSFGSGVGWFPLGPREIYVPGYWHSHRYIRNVNRSNTIIVNNIYIDNVYYGRNRHFDYRYGRMRDAVTVIRRDRFVGGRSTADDIADAFRGYRQQDLRNWRHDGRPPAIAPSRDSILASRLTERRPPTRVSRIETNQGGDRNSYRSSPARLSFDAERRAIEANNGRPISRSQLFASNPKDRGDFRGARSIERDDAKRPERTGSDDRNWRESNVSRALQLPDRSSQPNRRETNPTWGRSPTLDAARRNDLVRSQRDSDRPAWVRQRDNGQATQSPPEQSLSQQQRSRSEIIESRIREGSNESRRDHSVRPGDQVRQSSQARTIEQWRIDQAREQARSDQTRIDRERAAAPRVTAPSNNEARSNQSQPQWRRPERVEPSRTYESRREQSGSGAVRNAFTERMQNQDRTPSRSFDRAPSAPRQQFSQPREQPRSAPPPQPRVERSAPRQEHRSHSNQSQSRGQSDRSSNHWR